jgi:transposase
MLDKLYLAPTLQPEYPKLQVRQVGRPKTINHEYVSRLKELVSHSPRSSGYPSDRWTASLLSQHLANEFQIEISDRHINRLLKEMGLATHRRRDKKLTKEPSIKIYDLQFPLQRMTTSQMR